MKHFFIGKTKCKKKAYSSQKYAEGIIANISENSERDKLPTRAYKCEVCGYWHLTSKPLSEGKPLDKYLPGWKKFFSNDKEGI